MSRSPEDDLKLYYSERAPDFDAMRARITGPRALELAGLIQNMKQAQSGRRVLEIACGTGYWTQQLSETATSIVAVDAAPEMLAVARQRRGYASPIDFRLGDAYQLAGTPGPFTGAMASFWLSHVPRCRLRAFLSGLHSKLTTGAVVFLSDNLLPNPVRPIHADPGSLDTFEERVGKDGQTRRILKNFYDDTELKGVLSPHSDDIRIECGLFYWCATYSVAARASAGA
jgi:SAM-dependent methyltransferase